jgi:transcriptional regulator with XRE-family HTH domain
MNSRRWSSGTTEQSRAKRRRGVVLTPAGLKRLQAAILSVEIKENKGHRFTLEDLGDRINISTKTLSRLWSLNSGVDQKTLRLCFSAFDLELKPEDYTSLGESEEATVIELVPDVNTHTEQATGRTGLGRLDPVPLAMPYPDGPVPLNSPFYVERPPIEALAYQEITQPGCVIRIRAPREMGKSSLMLRLLTFAEAQHYHTVSIDCNQIESAYLTDLNRFLRSFCSRVAQELGIAPNLDDYWDDEIGAKLSCSFYFKNYLLEQIDNPVVLVMNEIDRLFEYPQLAQEFFPLLRSWYEEARRSVTLQKLRLVVVYSTEEYVALDINRSPFNIGLPLRLPEFTLAQVEDLAIRHGLDWSNNQAAAELVNLVGRHPALIRIAMYYICCQGATLEELVQDAIVTGGIFQYHLWRLWVTLQKNPNLVKTLETIVNSESGVSLNPAQIYPLEGQGLIRREGDRILMRCELYRAYFQQQFSTIEN